MSREYLLIPILIFSLTFYLISLLLTKSAVITKKAHRQFWNTILLLTFVITAFLGVIAVIKINYKLTIPWYEKLLTWHVDAGIGLFFAGIIHLSWHINYYVQLFKKSKKRAEKKKDDHFLVIPQMKMSSLRTLLVMIGITSLMTQVIFLREFMSVFSGNELVLGIILSNWMFITSFGAYMGKYIKKLPSFRWFMILFFLLIIVPLLSLFSIYILKNVIFPPGIQAGLLKIFYTSFFVLFPFCLLSGFLFTLLAAFASSLKKRNIVNRAYAIESVGSILGGVVFNFVLIFFLNTFQIIASLIFINSGLMSVLIIKEKKGRALFGLIVLYLLLAVSVFYFKVDKLTRQFLYKNQEIKYSEDTPYGNVTVTKHGDQLNFFENNTLIFDTGSPIKQEETVHFTLLQHPVPENVLLISGGITGMTNEILKYEIKHMDYVEINPWLIKVGKRFHSADLEHDKIRIIRSDPILFLKSTESIYDVVIINLPQPVNYQINRFYTVEFFNEIKQVLAPGAVLSTSLSPSANYISQDEQDLNSILYNTLEEVFSNVVILPGEKNYFIASDKNLRLDIGNLVKKNNIENIYVNEFYIDDFYLKQRSGFLLSNIKENAGINHDFHPRAFLSLSKLWLSKFKDHYWIIAGIMALFFTISLLGLNKISIGLFNAGFTASALEVVLLISFQIIYGYLYFMTGVIITVFMAGLITGTLVSERYFKEMLFSRYSNAQLFLVLISLLIPIVVKFLNQHKEYVIFIHAFFILTTFSLSFVTGLIFYYASRLPKTSYASVAATSYSIDLLGSGFGAFLVSIFLIPVLGILEVCYVTAGLNVISTIITRISRR